MFAYFLISNRKTPPPPKKKEKKRRTKPEPDLVGPNLSLHPLLLKESSGLLSSSPLCSLQVTHRLIPAGSGNALPQPTNIA